MVFKVSLHRHNMSDIRLKGRFTQLVNTVVVQNSSTPFNLIFIEGFEKQIESLTLF